MQFSLAKFMIALLFVNILAGMTFALPLAWSVGLMALVSVLVFPPIILVGCVQTRGLRQAFFLGALVAGTPHFIASVYYFVMFSIALVNGGLSWAEMNTATPSAEEAMLRYIHPVCYLIGLAGGLIGMGAHLFLRSGKPAKTPANPAAATQSPQSDEPPRTKKPSQ